MNDAPAPGPRRAQAGVPAAAAASGAVELADLFTKVARGDQHAFERVYELLAAPVYGLVLRVVRDPAQAEEVTQEVLVELWRKASHYRPERGGAIAWAMTIAHRRAIDQVRSTQAGRDREDAFGRQAAAPGPDYDQTADEVHHRLERQQVRRCLKNLTEVQRESITLAFYGGYTYREVADVLDVGLAAVKTRMRDGLIRLRDCLGVPT